MRQLLKNISLYRQLLVPMVVVGVIFTLITVYSALALKSSVTSLESVYEDGATRIRDLEILDKSLAEYRTLTLKHMASENAPVMQQIQHRLEIAEANILAYLKQIRQTSKDNQQANLSNIQQLTASTRIYFDNIRHAVDLSSDFEKEVAFSLLTKTESEHLPAINSVVDQLIRQAFDDVNNSSDALMSNATFNLQLTLVIGIGGGVLLLFIAYFVIKRINRRLSRLLNWSTEVSEGNYLAALNPETHDEVGQLTVAMGQMARKIDQQHQQLADAKHSAENVAESLRLYANAFESSGEAMLITDSENHIINVNKALTEQTGYSLDEVYGKDPGHFATSRTSKSTYEDMWRALEEHGFWQGELWDRKKSGEVYPKWASISVIRDADNEALFHIASFSDISERKAAEDRIAHLAHHDILTGLLNRFSLTDRLDQALATARRENQHVAVLFIDLDRFKQINDSLGHDIGDQFLVNVAMRLSGSVRESDILARIGGDEYVVVLTGMKSAMDAVPVVENIMKNVAQPCEISGNILETSMSMGISVFPIDGDNSADLIKNADVAMYHAKEGGRNNYFFFTETMLVTAKERLSLELELRNAIELTQFELYFQPQICTSDGRICGMETLLRWQHPHNGLVLPDKFIPLAEETGMIHSLGAWVIEQACRQLATWKQEGFQKIRLSVNLSTRQLQSEALCEQVKSAMQQHAICKGELEFEITETAAMDNPELAVKHMNSLQELGIRMAIDDFGMGYSSLAYLKRLPIQMLKLDRHFVRDIEHDKNDAEICLATLSLAHNLGLKVVAEGVENEYQRDFLIKHQCDCLQGFFYHEPMSASAATRYLKAHQPEGLFQDSCQDEPVIVAQA